MYKEQITTSIEWQKMTWLYEYTYHLCKKKFIWVDQPYSQNPKSIVLQNYTGTQALGVKTC